MTVFSAESLKKPLLACIVRFSSTWLQLDRTQRLSLEANFSTGDISFHDYFFNQSIGSLELYWCHLLFCHLCRLSKWHCQCRWLNSYSIKHPTANSLYFTEFKTLAFLILTISTYQIVLVHIGWPYSLNFSLYILQGETSIFVHALSTLLPHL